jgi:hypothetical protein
MRNQQRKSKELGVLKTSKHAKRVFDSIKPLTVPVMVKRLVATHGIELAKAIAGRNARAVLISDIKDKFGSPLTSDNEQAGYWQNVFGCLKNGA